MSTPTLGSTEFWKLYDELCNPAELTKLVDGQSTLVPRMHEIMRVAHKNRVIHHVSRPEKGWTRHSAWLSLKPAEIPNSDGDFGMFMRSGDVIAVEFGWDRDVVITHSPINRNLVSGYLLSGKWPPMIGLFMPLFDKPTIMRCIKLRLARNALEATALAEEESRDWGWYK